MLIEIAGNYTHFHIFLLLCWIWFWIQPWPWIILSPEGEHVQNVTWLLKVSPDSSCSLAAERREICSGSEGSVSLQGTGTQGGCAPALGDSWFPWAPDSLQRMHWQHCNPGLGRECPGSMALALRAQGPHLEVTEVTPVGAQLGTGLPFLLPFLAAPNTFLSAASVLVMFANLPVWHRTASSPHPQCGAMWKLHFMWKWTLNTGEIFFMPFLCHF